MSTGDQTDVFNRLKKNLVSWFGNDTPVLNAILKGRAATGSFIYELISYTKLQTRIKTATDYYLDYAAQDYLGKDFLRHPGENDDSFRNRILANLLPERATKAGMIKVLTLLTGRAPVVIENTDTFNQCAYDNTFYYDNYGGYGWLQPYTAIIYAFRPQPKGFLSVGGYDQTSWGGFGYDFNYNNAYIDLADAIVFVTDQDILDAIERTKVFGTYMYVTILD